MSKIRCSTCKIYIDKDDVYKTNGVTSFCSLECVYGKKSKKKPSRKPDVPQSVRDAVAERDGGRCRFCGVSRNTHLHHVRYRSEGGKHKVDNLLTLCVEHHDLMHSDKKRWQDVCVAAVSSPDSIPRLEKMLVDE